MLFKSSTYEHELKTKPTNANMMRCEKLYLKHIQLYELPGESKFHSLVLLRVHHHHPGN